jgi:hypothetical protein
VQSNHDVNRLGQLDVEGFEEVHATLFADGDPPLLMTHIPLRHVPDGCVNVHGHAHNALLTRTRHVNVSVEQIRYGRSNSRRSDDWRASSRPADTRPARPRPTALRTWSLEPSRIGIPSPTTFQEGSAA